MSPSDDILRRFRAGDRRAFAEIVTTYAAKVLGIARRYFRGVFDQEEAMQEVWVHLFNNRQALDVSRLGEFDGWLATLARRKCLDLLRKQGRLKSTAAAAELDALADQEPEVTRDPMEQRDIAVAVDQLKKTLEPQWRDFFELHFVQGLDYAEVAERLAVSRLRCKYMKKVLTARARKSRPLLQALGRWPPSHKEDGPHAS